MPLRHRPAFCRRVSVEALESRQMLSVSPQLLVEINWQGSSNPQNFVTVSEHLYFTADDGAGEKLWISDGTPQNVAWVYAGSQFEQLTRLGDLLYFTSRNSDGSRSLMVTNGLFDGTHEIAIPLDYVSDIFNLTEVRGQLYFTAESENGLFLGIADGTNVSFWQPVGFGERPYSELNVVTSDAFYFVTGGQITELWRSDGTAAGTYSINSLIDGGVHLNIEELEAVGDEVYFSTWSSGPPYPQLWKTDGTAAGTSDVLDGRVTNLTAAGEKLFFVSENWPYYSIRMTDGTPQGTQLVTQIESPQSITSNFRIMEELNGAVYFFSESTDIGWSTALWRTTGPGDVAQVFDTGRSLQQIVSGLSKLDDFLYFESVWGHYLTDGTARGTHLVPIHQGLATSHLAKLGDTLYFPAGLGTGIEPAYLSISPQFLTANLFYNDSYFDEDDPSLNYLDFYALASGKSPYRAGAGPATFKNVSNYVHGINGVMIDFAFVEGDLAPEDFVFRVGNSQDPATWTPAPQPSEMVFGEVAWAPFDIRDQARISWPNGAITNTWLEVTVLANQRTGLAQPEVFYFGSKVADSGTDPASGPFQTTPSDALQIFSFAGSDKTITDPRDYNRDGQITPTDALLVYANAGTLVRLDLPGPASPQVAPLRIESVDETTDQAVRSALGLLVGPETPRELVELDLPRIALPPRAQQSPNAIRDLMFAAAYEQTRQANDVVELDDELLDDLVAPLTSAPRAAR